MVLQAIISIGRRLNKQSRFNNLKQFQREKRTGRAGLWVKNYVQQRKRMKVNLENSMP